MNVFSLIRSDNFFNNMVRYITCFFCGILGSVIFMVIHNNYYKRSFATISMDKILKEHIKSQGKGKIREEERIALSSRYSEELKKVLTKMEKERGVIFLVRPAVISQLPDYTYEVINKLEGVLKNEK